jgi:hypothetical protein
VSARRSLALFAFVVAVFAFLGVRSELNQRGIERNAERIGELLHNQRVLFYSACADDRADNVRWNSAINKAIEAEKRKPKPDRERLADLAGLRRAVPGCGEKP